MEKAPSTTASALAKFEVSPEKGFLPTTDPLQSLPSFYRQWEDLAINLPKLLVSDQLRPLIEKLQPLDITKLKGSQKLNLAMLRLSYLGHAYIWAGGELPKKFPAGLAVPWHEISQKLGRPPILSYASYALHNWRRIDQSRAIELGNIALIQNFLGGLDEEWFVLIHVDIEAKSGVAMQALWSAQDGVKESSVEKVTAELTQLSYALGRMYKILERMVEHCDPYIYFHRVRPYIHGWKNHPALPQGLFYEGVSAYANQPQQFRGETGAQSAIIPALDAGLGVAHKEDPLRVYLQEMQEYMPPKHRKLLRTFTKRPNIRKFVSAHKNSDKPLVDTYDQCLDWLQKFRALHLEYAASYIFKQSQTEKGNPSAVGTGGTPFMPYLAKHRDETGDGKIVGG